MTPRSLVPFCAALLVCVTLPRDAGAAEPDRAASPRPSRAAGAADWKDPSVSLPVRLDERLRREALRFTDLSAPAASPLPGVAAEEDEEGRAARSRRVERLLTRAVRGALDDHLTEMARSSPAFERLFRVIDARDGDPMRGSGTFPAPQGAREPANRFDADVRLRIDAHPRLQMRARLGAITGSIEIPVLDPEVRLGLERPLGARGRAALQGGWSDGRGEWASVALSFSF
jgi:hypothetical protein